MPHVCCTLTRHASCLLRTACVRVVQACGCWRACSPAACHLSSRWVGRSLRLAGACLQTAPAACRLSSRRVGRSLRLAQACLHTAPRWVLPQRRAPVPLATRTFELMSTCRLQCHLQCRLHAPCNATCMHACLSGLRVVTVHKHACTSPLCLHGFQLLHPSAHVGPPAGAGAGAPAAGGGAAL